MKKQKKEVVANPMCGASRVFVCNVPARVISIEDDVSKEGWHDPINQGYPVGRMKLPVTTSSSVMVINNLLDSSVNQLDKVIEAQLCQDKVFHYLNCRVLNMSFSAAPGCRMEMEIVFSYLGKSLIDDRYKLEGPYAPERCLVWDDFLNFVDGGFGKLFRKRRKRRT